MACGFQNALNAYILPSVRCDMHVTSSMMGLFNAMFLAGGLSSGLLWGVLVDSIGRWPVLLFGMASDAAFSFVSSFSQSFYLLLVFRFLNGFVVGGPAAIILAYVGEFQPHEKRRQVLCYLGFFWTLSWVILPALAWVIVPLQWEVDWGDWKYNSWRFLIFLVGCPSLLSAIFLFRFPESPKFLLTQGRDIEALNIIAEIYSINTGEPPSSFPVKSLEYTGSGTSQKLEPKSIWKPLVFMLRQFRALLSYPVLPITLLACYLFFSNMFGYYGLGLWLPELMNRFESHYAVSNETVSVCQLEPATASTDADNMCTVPPKVFTQSLIIGSMGLIGNLLSGFLSSRLSRRTMPVALMAFAGLSVCALYFVTNSFQNMVVSAFFQLNIGTANMVYNSLIVDMFPPEVCGLAVCLAVLMGRLGAMLSNIVLGQLLDISCSTPIMLCAGVIFLGGLASWFIPREPYCEMKHQEKPKSVINA